MQLRAPQLDGIDAKRCVPGAITIAKFKLQYKARPRGAPQPAWLAVLWRMSTWVAFSKLGNQQANLRRAFVVRVLRGQGT